jgi:type IV secretory pathway TraG/TraD family ATPase VirD4
MTKSVEATLHNHVRPLMTLAALWHRARYWFSLAEWHERSGVLLMGADPRRERTLQRVNKLMFERISQLVLGRNKERSIDLTWFFLDEIREAGKLRGLRQLLTEGRSKGARVVLGFQDIDGMTEVFGQHGAEELIGLCANRMILHLDNPRACKWTSDVFGEVEKEEETTNKGRS